MAASSPPEDRNKPVIGHPSDEPHVATGYPCSAAAHPTSDSYFYIPAPPSPHFPARHRPRNRDDHPRPNSALSVCAYLLLLVLLTFGVFSSVYIILFVLQPLPPSFHLGSAFFPPILFPPRNDGVFWNLSMQVTNPNSKLAILYDGLETSVLYKGKYLTARTELSPIDQEHGNRTFWHARLQSVGVLDGIGAGEERNGVVSYGVRVLGTVRFRSCGGWRTRKRLMKVFCDGVEIGYGGSGGGVGSLLNPGKECGVEI